MPAPAPVPLTRDAPHDPTDRVAPCPAVQPDAELPLDPTNPAQVDDLDEDRQSDLDDDEQQAFLDKFYMHLDGQLPPEDLPSLQHLLDHTPNAGRLAMDALRLDHLLREVFAE